jgi:hypothetical protein
MRQLLSQQAYRSVMCNVVSILNPKLRWANIEYDAPECMPTHNYQAVYPCIVIYCADCVVWLPGLVI